MSAPGTLKLALKRGALVTAANWQVVMVQFVADTLFKTLLMVPVVGGVVLVALLVGGEPSDLLRLDPAEVIPRLVAVLRSQPLALAAFLTALGLVLAGGSVLTFAAKAGTVTLLVRGERSAGPVEAPPLRLEAIGQAAAWSLDRFMAGVSALLGRYLRLGAGLSLAYLLLAAAYAAVVMGRPATPAVDWTLVVLLASLALLVLVTLVNFVYLLMQMVVAAEDCAVHEAVPHVWRLLRRRGGDLFRVLASILALLLLSTAASIMATAALGLVAFVPFVGLAAIPLQIGAWLVRGVVFQYVGLTGLVAYLRLHRMGR